MPSSCPACGGEVVKPAGEAMSRCVNSLCPAQLFELVKHFAGREAMDIRGLGDSLARVLVDRRLIGDVGDIYSLHVDRLKELERYGEKSAQNLAAAIARSRERPYARVLFALGIRHVGLETAKLLAERFPSIDALDAATAEEIQAVPGVGRVIAESVKAWSAEPANRGVIEKLREAGVRLAADPADQAATEGLPLSGQEVVITGKLASFSRTQATEAARAAGAVVKDSVTKSTSLLVAGADPGSKLKRAQQLGIRIVDEETFRALLDGHDAG